MLRDSFDKKYNWAKQIKDLTEKMISWVHGMNVNLIMYIILIMYYFINLHKLCQVINIII